MTMSCKDMISAAQIRAARGLLDWSRRRLAKESGIGISTIADFETERTSAMLSTNMGKLIEAFARAGVVFIAADRGKGGAGVRFREEGAK